MVRIRFKGITKEVLTDDKGENYILLDGEKIVVSKDPRNEKGWWIGI